jgi:hypothetical protein
MAGILPTDVNKLGWGDASVRKQRDTMGNDANELVMGKNAPEESADYPLISAKRTQSGLPVKNISGNHPC